MEKKEVTAGHETVVGEITLVPIVRTTVACRSGSAGVIGFAAKDVLGILVGSPTGWRAVNAAGEDVPVAEYVRQVPGLAAWLGEG